MRKFFTVAFVGSLLVLAAGPGIAQDDAVKKERAKLQGAWKVVSSEEDTRPTPDIIVQNLTVVIKGDQITLKGVEELMKKFGKVTMTIDPATKPKIMDFKVEAGSEKDNAYEGIYELKGDELKICVSTARGNRPDEFKTKAGSTRALFVLKREKP